MLCLLSLTLKVTLCTVHFPFPPSFLVSGKCNWPSLWSSIKVLTSPDELRGDERRGDRVPSGWCDYRLTIFMNVLLRGRKERMKQLWICVWAWLVVTDYLFNKNNDWYIHYFLAHFLEHAVLLLVNLCDQRTVWLIQNVGCPRTCSVWLLLHDIVKRAWDWVPWVWSWDLPSLTLAVVKFH